MPARCVICSALQVFKMILDTCLECVWSDLPAALEAGCNNTALNMISPSCLHKEGGWAAEAGPDEGLHANAKDLQSRVQSLAGIATLSRLSVSRKSRK